jgi:hypothetical protein
VGVFAATLLLLADRPQKTFGDIAFGARPNDAVVVGVAAQLLLEVSDAALEAFGHIGGFAANVLQLTIRHLRQISDKHLAVVGKG